MKENVKKMQWMVTYFPVIVVFMTLYIADIYSSFLYLLHNHVDILIADMIQVTL